MLSLQEVHRFSIGIDIMVEPSIDEEMIATALRAMMENSTHFIDHEEGPRRGSSRIRHFRFYY